MRTTLLQVVKERVKARDFLGFLLLIVLIIPGIITARNLHANADATQIMLPGEQIWKQNVSSYLFGANDASWSWSQYTMGNTPAIAATVRAAGITVIRAPLHSTDALARVSAIEAAGAQCLGILSPQDAVQVVQMLGSRCNMYEWMNEPDNGGPSASSYAASWNQYIPQLRGINPNAAFIGPVVAYPDTNYIQQFLSSAQAAGNLPDVVSFHVYPCTDQTIATCPPHIGGFARGASQVQATITSVLGHPLPLAITEWNFSWKNGQTPQHDPYMQQFSQQALENMAQAGIVMANQFDIASNAGGGSLDMVDPQSGQAWPQLAAMGSMIQAYRSAVASAPTQPAQPTAVHLTPLPQPKPSTVPVVAFSPPQLKSFLAGQSLSCAPVVTIAGHSGGSTTIEGSDTGDGCTFVTRIDATHEKLLLAWWGTNGTAGSQLTITTSLDSTNGYDGTWQELSGGALVSIGGAQVVSVPWATWVKVSIMAPGAGKPAIIGTVNLYDADTFGSRLSGELNRPLLPAPIILPRQA